MGGGVWLFAALCGYCYLGCCSTATTGLTRVCERKEIKMSKLPKRTEGEALREFLEDMRQAEGDIERSGQLREKWSDRISDYKDERRKGLESN